MNKSQHIMETDKSPYATNNERVGHCICIDDEDEMYLVHFQEWPHTDITYSWWVCYNHMMNPTDVQVCQCDRTGGTWYR